MRFNFANFVVSVPPKIELLMTTKNGIYRFSCMSQEGKSGKDISNNYCGFILVEFCLPVH